MNNQRRLSDEAPAGPSDLSHNAPLGASDQACNECKRRKGKCDRLLPECTPCARNKRHCLYEKSSRSPLTRKYLTEVEERLRRAEIRAWQFEKRAQVAETRLNQAGSSSSAPVAIVDNARSASITHEVKKENDAVSTPASSLHSREWNTPDRRGDAAAAIRRSASIHSNSPYDHFNSDADQGLENGPALPYEAPPSEADDFDWDEQSQSNKLDLVISETIKDPEDAVADGMASLAVEDRSTGYLGIASGAAMLRLLLPDADHNRPFRSRRSPRAGSDITKPAPDLWEDLKGLDVDLDGAVNAYFGLYHLSYPIVHEPTFRAQYAHIIHRPNGRCWNALAFMIGAIGLWTTSQTHSNNDDLKLFEAAKSNLSIDSLESGNLTLVQVLTLMSNYIQKRNKPNSGYNYLGLALHIAMGLGLHKEFQNWKIAPLTMEIRRRVWYTLYVFYVGALITFGRPVSWPDKGVEVVLPLNIWDRDLTAASQTLPKARETVTTYSASIAQANFHLATMEIYTRVISPRFPTAQELLRLDERYLGAWMQTLGPWYSERAVVPEKFALSHHNMFSRVRNFRIIMYRPFVIRKALRGIGSEIGNSVMRAGDAEEQAINVCLAEARATIETNRQYWSTQPRNRLASWYCLYFVFQASLIPCVCLRNSPNSTQASDWKSQIKTALSIIQDMEKINPSCQECANVIVRLCGAYLHSELVAQSPSSSLIRTALNHLHQQQQQLGITTATEESPQTQLYQVYPMMWPGNSTGDMDALMQDMTWTNFLEEQAASSSAAAVAAGLSDWHTPSIDTAAQAPWGWTPAPGQDQDVGGGTGNTPGLPWSSSSIPPAGATATSNTSPASARVPWSEGSMSALTKQRSLEDPSNGARKGSWNDEFAEFI